MTYNITWEDKLWEKNGIEKAEPNLCVNPSEENSSHPKTPMSTNTCIGRILFLVTNFKANKPSLSLEKQQRKSLKETEQKGQKETQKPMLLLQPILLWKRMKRNESENWACEEERLREEEAKKEGNMVGEILDSLQAVRLLLSLFTHHCRDV